MSPAAYLVTFFAAVFAAMASIPLIGNALPTPHGTYIPMLVGHDFVRDEHIRQYPLAEDKSPCVALIGDSRVAFNISGAIIDKALPLGCRSQNYGFPSVSLTTMLSIIEENAFNGVIVLSASEIMLDPPSSTRWQGFDNFKKDLLQSRWLRYLYLGHQRVLHLLRATFSPNLLIASDWIWSSEEKRWQFASLKNRVLVEYPEHDRNAAVLANGYFSGRAAGSSEYLESVLSKLTEHSKVILVIPPSEERFQVHADKIDGRQRAYWKMIHEAAAKTNTPLIDCSSFCIDQAAFADPVHLNDRGVVAYSEYLAPRIAKIVNGSSRLSHR